jgi:membrane protein YdbS with pleckstrin-like domain
VFDGLRGALLRWLRVPAEPEPPLGSAESIRVFRAGINFYKWSVIQWGLKQAISGFGLTVALTALNLSGVPPLDWPEWLRVAFVALEAIVVSIFVAQLLLSYFALRLDFDMRWYMVTDRSLRIRSGIWFVEELTMTFANIQQVNLTQGPLQRVLGIADLEVTSAGGGSGKKQGRHRGEESHTGAFEGMENAEAIRDLILDRLRHYRDAGLGNPDDHHEQAPDALAAAHNALLEAQALRALITSIR